MLMTCVRLAGIGCIALLLALSLMPAHDMVRTGAPKGMEHFTAYFLTAILLCLGFGRRGKLAIVFGLSALAAAMEILQHFSPGRTPHLSDFVASSVGGLLGVGVTALAVSIVSSRWLPR